MFNLRRDMLDAYAGARPERRRGFATHASRGRIFRLGLLGWREGERGWWCLIGQMAYLALMEGYVEYRGRVE